MFQRVVILKDVANKATYEDSAQVACEAAGAIRTVASLTREADCSRIYSESLQEPIRRSRRSMLGSNMLYAVSQSISYVTPRRRLLDRDLIITSLDSTPSPSVSGLN